VKISASLPNEVKSISYFKNHLGIILEDHEGNTTKLNATGVLIGKCGACEAMCVALSSMGDMKCTHCGGAVKWAWHKPQIAFLPESASGFLGADAWRNSLKRAPLEEAGVGGIDIAIPLPKTES
jgi:hypothetical protein